MLRDGLSPDQLVGRLKKQKIANISYETVYRYIYANQRSGGRLYKLLRHKNKKYGNRSSQYKTRGQIKNRVNISKRAKIIEKKIKWIKELKENEEEFIEWKIKLRKRFEEMTDDEKINYLLTLRSDNFDKEKLKENLKNFNKEFIEKNFLDEKNSIHMKGPVSEIKEIDIKF